MKMKNSKLILTKKEKKKKNKIKKAAGQFLLFKRDDKLINNLKIFGENFGILFQIKDDINNFKICSDKPFYNDMEEGIYTAPIIFLSEEFPQTEQMLINKDFENVIKMLNSSGAIEKTEKLAQKYYTKAETALGILPDNQYKTALKNLLSKL